MRTAIIGAGLVGSYLLKILLENNNRVFVLARRDENSSAEERVSNALVFWNGIIKKQKLLNLTVMEGDISKENLGLSSRNIDILQNAIEEIFNCAAVTEINWSLDKIRIVISVFKDIRYTHKRMS